MGSPAALATGARFEDYRVLGMLDSGDRGAVYEVEELGSRRRLALRLIHGSVVVPGFDLTEFDRSLRSGHELDPEHYVQVLRSGMRVRDGTPWFVMPLLRGESGSARVRGKGPLGAQHTIGVFDQSCRALQRAHREGHAHGALEPDSFFFRSGTGGGTPFSISLLDYGVAGFVDTGDKLWRAPEQNAGTHPGPRGDVWSLGLVGFFMLTGRSFWDAQGARTPAHGRAAIPTAQDAAASLDVTLPYAQAFDTWFSKCVNVDPAERFEDAAALLKGLRKVLAGVALNASAKRVHSIAGAQSQVATLEEPDPAVLPGPNFAPLQAISDLPPLSGPLTHLDSQGNPTEIPATQIPVTQAAAAPVVVVAPRRSSARASDLRSPSNIGAANTSGPSGLSALAQGAIGGCAIGAVGIAVVCGLLVVLVLVLVFAVSGKRAESDATRISARRPPGLLVFTAKLGDHREIFQGGHVALSLPTRGDVLE